MNVCGHCKEKSEWRCYKDGWGFLAWPSGLRVRVKGTHSLLRHKRGSVSLTGQASAIKKKVCG